MQATDRFGLVGTIVADKYAIEGVVGEGGFGIVYRAQHQIWDQPVAIKCFTALSNAPQEMRAELLDTFVQEGKLLSALSSRTAAIVQARDIGTLTTPTGTWLPYMVLEWLEGAPLERLVKPSAGGDGRARSAAEVFQLLDGAARALALAHANGVAHRDIKPDNFFVIGGRLAPGAVIKVLDFGIAKVMQSQAQTAMRSTGAKISSFTPSYGAPENFDRGHGATGPWTDVYQMALVFLEMMRGGRPVLDGETFLQLAFASQNPDRRPTPRALGLEVAPAVEAVFARALAVPVTERYPNMGAFWTALGAALGIADFAPLPTAPTAEGGPGEAGGGGAARAALSTQPVASVTPSLAIGAQAGPVVPGGKTLVSPTGPGGQGFGVTLPSGATGEPGAAAAPAARGRGPALAFGAAAAAVAAVAAVLVLRQGDEAGPKEPPTTAESGGAAAAGGSEGGAAAAGGSEGGAAGGAAEAAPPRCPEGMALVAGGTYFMGTDEDNPVLRSARPAHQVEVAAFCIDVTEVTVDAYRACSRTGRCKRAFREARWPHAKDADRRKRAENEKLWAAYSPLCNERYDDRGDHPINCVMWEQARAYCEEVGKRLPSEAEWEFAARGSDGRKFPWGDEAPTARHLNACGLECIAWRVSAGLDEGGTLYAEDDGFPATAPVGSFAAGKTQAGLLDMVGNVFEWTADPFAPYPGSDAKAPEGDSRVIRGGAFNSTEIEHTDPSLRYPQAADAYSHGVGFRCASAPLGGDAQG